jgi:hypothetical protein
LNPYHGKNPETQTACTQSPQQKGTNGLHQQLERIATKKSKAKHRWI